MRMQNPRPNSRVRTSAVGRQIRAEMRLSTEVPGPLTDEGDQIGGDPTTMAAATGARESPNPQRTLFMLTNGSMFLGRPLPQPEMRGTAGRERIAACGPQMAA
jgi:hypothetical protein